MDTAKQRILSVAISGFLVIAVAIGLARILGSDEESTAVQALVEVLIVTGVGTIFGAIFLAALGKLSAQVKTILGCVGLVGTLLCVSMMYQLQDSPEIFSPVLLAYPSLGLTVMAILDPLIHPSSSRSPR